MISTKEALKIIKDKITPLAATTLPLKDAAGLTLAADVYATIDIPAYPQSSMDGYAFSFDGYHPNNDITIQGESSAGSAEQIDIQPGTAVRIFTGAPVPEGADTVVMQEKVIVKNNTLTIADHDLKKGANVRAKGSEINTGNLALSNGNTLSPAAIGFLAGIGIKEVSVFPNLSVTIITTGNELKQPGELLSYGQVYESNSFALTAALHHYQIKDITIRTVKDELTALTEVLQQALASSDIVLLTGGVSVGDYDFVLQAASNCKVTTLFHKVKQRPGKPLFFGKWQEKPVFGLPGNPSSVLSCFYMYVVPALERMCQRGFSIKKITAPLVGAIAKPAGLTHFQKGYFDGKSVESLAGQESYRMASFAKANCLIELDENLTYWERGSLVTIHQFQ